MEGFFVIYGSYVVPTAALVGATLLVAHLLRKPSFLPFEYFAWLLPGLLYWLMFEPMDLTQAFRGKTLANIGEPFFLGLICSLLFILRTIAGAMIESKNGLAAWWNLGLANVAAIVVFIFMPQLPE